MASASDKNPAQPTWWRKYVIGKSSFLFDIGWAAGLLLLLIALPWSVCQFAGLGNSGQTIIVAAVSIIVFIVVMSFLLRVGESSYNQFATSPLLRRLMLFVGLLLGVAILANSLEQPLTWSFVGASKKASTSCQINAWRYIFGNMAGILSVIVFVAGIVKWYLEREGEQIKSAMAKIHELCPLAEQDPSEYYRRYHQNKKAQGIWQKPEVQKELEESWNECAPKELIKIQRLLNDRKSIPVDDKLRKDIEWGWKRLDEEMKAKLSEAFLHLIDERQEEIKRLFDPIMEELWWRCIGISLSSVAPHKNWPSDQNQFEFATAETDKTLLNHPSSFTPHLSTLLSEHKPYFIIGDKGLGKTAAAFLFTWKHLQTQTDGTLPIYWRLPIALLPETNRNAVFRKLACTSMTYCAQRPTDYLNLKMDERARLVSLWSYCSPGVAHALEFYKRGLDKYGPGGILLQDVEGLLHDTKFKESLRDVELLSETAIALPKSFTHTTVIMDLQDEADWGRSILIEQLPALQNLMQLLATHQIYIKVLVPAETLDKQTWEILKVNAIDTVTLSWTIDDLKDIIGRRLGVDGSKKTTLKEWCDPGVKSRHDFNLDDCVARCAKGSPTTLLQLCSKLWRRYHADEGRQLTWGDIKAILGKEQLAACTTATKQQGQSDEHGSVE